MPRAIYIIITLLLSAASLTLTADTGQADLNLLAMLASDRPAYENYDRISRRAASMSDTEIVNQAELSYIRDKNVEQAMSWYHVLISRYSDRQVPDADINPTVYTNLAYFWLFERNNAEQAFPLLMRALELSRLQKNDGATAAILSNLAKIFATYRDWDKAMDYYRQSSRLALKSKDKIDATYALADLISFAWLQDSLPGIGAECSAYSRVKLDGTPMSRYNSLAISARHKYLSRDYAGAVTLLERAGAVIDDRADSLRRVVNNSLMIARTARLAGSMPLALRQIERAESLANSGGLPDLLDPIYDEMIAYYEASGDSPHAMAVRLRAYAMRDSIYNNHRFGIIKDMESAWQVGKLDDTIRRQKQENLQIAQQRDRQRLITVLIVVPLLIIMTLALGLYRKNRRLNQSLAELYRKNLELAGAPAPPAQPLQEPEYEDICSEAEDNSVKATADPELEAVFASINEFLATSPQIYDPDFSISQLAEGIGRKSRQVSSAINNLAGTNFSLYLGRFRVREACRILADREHSAQYTIQAVAEKVGYRSRTYFSKVFKDETGITTTEFIRQSKRADQH